MCLKEPRLYLSRYYIVTYMLVVSYYFKIKGFTLDYIPCDYSMFSVNLFTIRVFQKSPEKYVSYNKNPVHHIFIHKSVTPVEDCVSRFSGTLRHSLSFQKTISISWENLCGLKDELKYGTTPGIYRSPTPDQWSFLVSVLIS